MAAFHPATVRLLREQQRQLVAQHKRDLGRAAKLPNNSKSFMAQRLRERIAEAMEQIRDLERILPVHGAGTAPKAELDEHAQWIADGRALLDFIEARADLPLPNCETTYSAFPRGTDDDERDEVQRAADILGVAATERVPGHLLVEHRIGRHTYQVLAITKARMERGDMVRRLGEAALAKQSARAESEAC